MVFFLIHTFITPMLPKCWTKPSSSISSGNPDTKIVSTISIMSPLPPPPANTNHTSLVLAKFQAQVNTDTITNTVK